MGKYSPRVYVHGSKLIRKARRNPNHHDLQSALAEYEKWRAKNAEIDGRTPDDIKALVNHLNDYKNSTESIFDARPNSAQEVLQPSILEEFFEVLFCNVSLLVNVDPPVRGPAQSYIDLIFNPTNLANLIDVPEYTIQRKDHDFVLGSRVNLALTNPASGNTTSANELIIPAVAIECKRYLERNMLDECSGTAERVKRATPYCMYLVVSEFLKMDDGFPELSKIDEVFVLRKQRNSDRNKLGFVPNPIDASLVIELFEMVIAHLRRIWWDPKSALKTGRLFNT